MAKSVEITGIKIDTEGNSCSVSYKVSDDQNIGFTKDGAIELKSDAIKTLLSECLSKAKSLEGLQ